MSFFLFEFDNASFYLDREKTQEELIRDRKLSELTNALFEVRYLILNTTLMPKINKLKKDLKHFLFDRIRKPYRDTYYNM